MASISSLGVGSGLDIRGLVDQLIAAESDPKNARWDAREAELQAQISSLGTLKSALSDFQSNLSGLRYSSNFRDYTATSSHEDIFTATASSGVTPGTHTIEVTQLAKAHSIGMKAADAVSSVGDVIGTGDLTIEFGTFDGAAFTPNASKAAETITITDGSLAGIRDSINDANIGVNANIVYDGSGYRLTLTSESGADNSLKITVNDDDLTDTDTSGLSQLAYDPAGTTNLEENIPAQDAQVLVNGVLVSSASNTLTDTIENVTLDLKSAQVGTEATLTIDHDVDGIKTAIETFVESFNEVVGTLNELTYYDSSTGEKGVFLGDASVRNIENSMRSIITDAWGDNDSAYDSFASLGILTQRDGTLAIDEDTLNDAVQGANLEDLRMLFVGGYRDIDTSLYDYTTLPSTIDAGSFAFEITQAATQGSYTGDVVSNLNITAGNDTFTLLVDGVATGNITLTNQVYADGSALATEIQTQLDADSVGQNVLVAYDTATNKLTFTSKTWGSTSSISVNSTTGTFANDTGIGGAGGSSTAGQDVAGTIGGIAATGSGRVLTGSGDYAGVDITYYGTAATKVYAQDNVTGMIGELNSLLNSFILSDGIINAKNENLNGLIDDINDSREALDVRLESMELTLMKKFGAMDALVAQLNSTSSYLASQLQSLPGAKSSK